MIGYAGPADAVIVANQQNATVLIRLDRIDAVALD